MTEPNKYGTKEGNTIVNKSPSMAPTPKTVWGTVAGAPIGGAISILLLEALTGNGIFLSDAAQVAVHTLIQAFSSFGAMYLTPPAGWSGNYGKDKS